MNDDMHCLYDYYRVNGMSPFEDAFRDLRVSGSVLLHGAHGAPWAVAIPPEARLRAFLGVNDQQRVIPFHLVLDGGFQLQPEGGRQMDIRADHVVLCPGGGAHMMKLGEGAETIAFEKILGGETPQPPWRGETELTELICGAFIVQAAPLNPLLAALPPVLTCPVQGPEAGAMIGRVAEMLALEVRSPERQLDGFTCGRLLEIFCAEVIRTYQRAGELSGPGWFRGLNDPRIAKAIAEIHAAPERAWSVEQLAELAALSPSRFAARFRDTVGETVMAYVTKWRLNVACRLLKETDLSIEAIAERVGYSGAPTFTRAFGDYLGRAPTRWRSGL